MAQVQGSVPVGPSVSAPTPRKAVQGPPSDHENPNGPPNTFVPEEFLTPRTVSASQAAIEALHNGNVVRNLGGQPSGSMSQGNRVLPGPNYRPSSLAIESYAILSGGNDSPVSTVKTGGGVTQKLPAPTPPKKMIPGSLTGR